ncbi:MAG: sulfatase [Verrucomicrobiales bacterium]
MQHRLALILALATLTTAAPAGEGRPNILVFLIDDMGVMDTSVPFLTGPDGQPERYALNEFYRTPNMQRLADQGVRFSRFYAMSVCSPTRASIMNGQTSARHHTTQFIKPESNNAGAFGAQGWQWEGITSDDITLPTLLKRGGYRTIHCGKAHFGPVGAPAEDPTNIGFDVNIAGCAWGQPGSYYGTQNFGNGIPKRQKRAVPGLEKYHGEDIYLTEALTLEMNAAITESVDAGKPFFAYMSHYAVHAPFQADPRFVGQYTGRKKQLAAFASMIEGMDKSLGDMLDHLDELGVAGNTLVLFLGDNGTDAPIGGAHAISCAAPLRGKKATHYEGGMRVPFIAAWAKPDAENPAQKRTPIEAGAITSQLGAVYDLLPTLLGAAEVELPENTAIDGIDLRKFFNPSPQGTIEREFLMHFPHQHRSSYFTSFHKGDWKLVYHYRPAERDTWDRIELFDLAADPTESKNLAAENPEKLGEMFGAMSAALDRSGAQFPLADDKENTLKPTLAN